MNEFEICCAGCKEVFILRQYEYENLKMRGKNLPRYCKFCSKEYHARLRIEQEQLENEKRLVRKAEEKIYFETCLKDRNLVDKDSILARTDTVLYVVGNGFDLLHGVKSSYYDFQKTLGKNSELRFYLENYLSVDDIWADFEEALAHLNVELMSNDVTIDTYLDIYGAYEKDASAASFFGGAESAANPAQIIAEELKKRFRTWVESISVQTNDRPLQNLMGDHKVLCFNYTEFVETLYHVDSENICYIHGSRKKQKGHPKSELVLGHLPGAGDSAYEFECDSYLQKSGNMSKRYLIEAAREITLRNISYYDDTLTKHCDQIIDNHKDFFQDMQAVTDVIVIGHSLSAVDRDYFKEIIRNNLRPDKMNWYFSCYGMRDLHNIDEFISDMSIDEQRVCLFRTDNIFVEVDEREEAAKSFQRTKDRLLCTSHNNAWSIKERDGKLMIYDNTRKELSFSRVFSTNINKAQFIADDKYLLLIAKGIYEGVFLLHCQGEMWSYVAELEPIPNQGVINRRLQRVLYTDDSLIFVYNNRVRKYRLSDGSLVENQQRRNAPSYTYQGVDIKLDCC